MMIDSQFYMIINIAVVILTVVMIVTGMKKGFLMQLLDCIGLILSLFVAWLFSPVMAEMAMIVPSAVNPAKDTLLGPWLQETMNLCVWFVVIFILVKLLLLLVRPFVAVIGKFPLVKQVNGLLGGVFGVITTGIWMVLFSVILMFPYFENGQDVIDNTLLSVPGKVGVMINDKILEMPVDEEKVQQMVQGWDQLTDSDRTLIHEWISENEVTLQNVRELLLKLKGE